MNHAPLKRLARISSGTGFPIAYQGEESEDVSFFKVGSLKSVDLWGMMLKSRDTISFQTAVGLGAEIIPENSSLMAKIGAATVLGRVAQNPKECCIDNNLMALIPKDGTHPRFLYYLLHTIDLAPLMNPGAVPNLNLHAFRHRVVPYPEPSSQFAIADYLDHEIAEIDAFISDTKGFAALALERSSAQHAIWLTQGTKQNPTLTQDHEVDWLQGARIPEHWETVKLGLVARLRSGDSITAADIDPSGEYPVYGGGGLRGYTSSWTHNDDQVMFGRQGALCGQVFVGHGPLFATEHAVVVEPSGSLDLKWLEYLLHFMNLGQYSTSAAQPGLSVDDVSKLRIFRPPLDEQESVGRYIARDQASMDVVHQEFKTATTLALERRAALISAAVTGQIDVTERRKPVAEELEDEVRQNV
ncbi:restriction endonuclease subunit S [Nesterenkonia sandarakina]|uniref:Type I restriction enzyme S subunit n=1 Tax=Nesterenkonia sandarakina TaxID=272918 RepID=A0A2T0YBT5_9MICC|nr:restriction endonuclease subunit S [Nesterenkonia sandarakina]PRZ12209.1 type I restriction enzyme S subunit [Nesterenkonia sandarakina]